MLLGSVEARERLLDVRLACRGRPARKQHRLANPQPCFVAECLAERISCLRQRPFLAGDDLHAQRRGGLIRQDAGKEQERQHNPI